MDPEWSETGDRYLLKLFRDYVFHQVTDTGIPWVDLAHIVSCLNKVYSSYIYPVHTKMQHRFQIFKKVILFIQIFGIRPFVQINSLSNNILVEILLYGDKDFSDAVNKTILELSVKFINETGRFY